MKTTYTESSGKMIRFTQRHAEIYKQIMALLKEAGMSFDKLQDGMCGYEAGFEYVNSAQNGSDCETKDGLIFENKRNIIPVLSVTLEDTGKEKADSFMTNPGIYLCSSALLQTSSDLNTLTKSIIKDNTKLTKKEITVFKKAIKDFYNGEESGQPLFQVFGKTTMLPLKRNRISGKLLNIVESVIALGEKRKNISFTYPSLLKAGFIVVNRGLSMEATKLYFKAMHPRAFNHIKFITAEEYSEHVGDYDYFFNS